MTPASSTRNRTELEPWMNEIARRQHGVVSRAQLLDRGVARGWIDGRVRSRRLRPLHRGVYLVGPLRTTYTRPMAALLAGGPGAAIGYRSAGALLGFAAKEPKTTPVHVLVLGCDRGRMIGLHPHRVNALPSDEVTERKGIRLTTPARTFVDLAGASTSRELVRALARAERLELIDRKELARIAARHQGRRGIGRLRRLLKGEKEIQFTRSRAEEEFRALVCRARLPRPEVNVVIQGLEVDFLWRGRRLVVEVDGFEYHSSKRAFETDRRRDADLTAAGFRVVRLTWHQLQNEPEAVAARVALALGQSAGALVGRLARRGGRG